MNNTIEIGTAGTTVMAILVLHLGRFLSSRIPWLTTFNIPDAVSGGLVCSGILALVYWIGHWQVSFALDIRDTLLLVFFCTIGLSAKLRALISGGKALIILVVCVLVVLVLQNLAGISVATSFGANPAYGLLAGSVAFAGGHGSSISYGQLASDRGLAGAVELGLACSTFGLIAGGLVGGPIARHLITKFDLSSSEDHRLGSTPGGDSKGGQSISVEPILNAILLLAFCIGVGSVLDAWLGERVALPLPAFLTTMFLGILIVNASDFAGIELPNSSIDLCGDISLQLFLAMSLMSLQLWTLKGAMGPLLVVLLVQITVMAALARFVIFPAMGRDYDAAVMSSGFAGLGLGATPVGIANMHAVTEKFGASPKAFLVVPLVGAFFLDIANALVIQAFLRLHLYFAGTG